MTDTVYVTCGGKRWHTDADCRALDAGRMLWDSDEDSPYPVREVSTELAADKQDCFGDEGRHRTDGEHTRSSARAIRIYANHVASAPSV